jgi:pimeloyl-ACP methyl ester carboxylesterase
MTAASGHAGAESSKTTGHETGLIEATMKSHDDPTPVKGSYLSVNGLEMYYEVRGQGQEPPLVLLHGALVPAEFAFGKISPSLERTRRVIAIEQQGHGHTADIDRPLHIQQMADDTVALLQQIRITEADLLGWSMGGTIALQIAVRHPALVRKLILTGATYKVDPEMRATIATLTPQAMPPFIREAYERAAPDRRQWPTLFAKWKQMVLEFEGIPCSQMQLITSPTLVMSGDGGGDRPEDALEIFRLLPHAQLAVLPGTSHFTISEHPEWLLSMVSEFLKAPRPT